MADKKPALGRGLSALLNQGESNYKNISPAGNDSAYFGEIEVKLIEANPYQPRSNFDADALSELAESIKMHGLIQPITVRKINPSKYQLISGERRLRASILSNQERIPAYIRETNDQGMLEMALIENIQRENLDAIEMAVSYKRLMEECNLNQEEMATRVSKKRSTIANYLRLLKLPPIIQIAIKNAEISMGHARALISVENNDIQLAIFQKIKELNLSVRKTEELVKNASLESIKNLGAKKPRIGVSYEEMKLQNEISEKIGNKVQIKKDLEGKGKMIIHFNSENDLSRILDFLDAKD